MQNQDPEFIKYLVSAGVAALGTVTRLIHDALRGKETTPWRVVLSLCLGILVSIPVSFLIDGEWRAVYLAMWVGGYSTFEVLEYLNKRSAIR